MLYKKGGEKCHEENKGCKGVGIQKFGDTRKEKTLETNTSS